MTLKTFQGGVARLEAGHRLRLTEKMPPVSAGRYLMAWPVGPDVEPLATPLLPAGLRGDVCCAVDGQIDWLPGTRLWLRGPLGHGFHLPPEARRVALLALDEDPWPLLPLAGTALAQQAAVVLFGPLPDANLPPSVEVRPLHEASDALPWADYLALSLRLEHLQQVGDVLGRTPKRPMPGRAEALLRTPMPCGGLADCGVCAVQGKHHPLLLCKQGPVLAWGEWEG